jgi:hypothetical protein
MTGKTTFGNANTTLTVRLSLAVRRRGGRRIVLAPQGLARVSPRVRIDSAMIKAVARAFRWRRLIETGIHATIEEIAQDENINSSYVARVLRLALLAPDTIEAILDGRQPTDLTLGHLLRPFPVEWRSQQESLLGTASDAASGVAPLCVG